MDSAELRAVQQPLKDTYREHPEQAVITLRAHGQLEDQAICVCDPDGAPSVWNNANSPRGQR